MQVINPAQQVQYITTETGDILEIRTYSIPHWNMDLISGASVNIDLTDEEFENFVGITGIIQNDAQDRKYSIPFVFLGSPPTVELYFSHITKTSATVERRTGGYFDSASYDDTTIERGRVYVTLKKV
jgi:hypothetical protein